MIVQRGTRGHGTIAQQGLGGRRRSVRCQGPDGADVLAVDGEAFPARHDHPDRAAPGGEQFDDMGRGGGHVLGVVDHRHDVEVAGAHQRLFDRCAIDGQPEPGGDRGGHLVGIGERAEFDHSRPEPVAWSDPRCEFDRKASLADSARSDEGDDRCRDDQIGKLVELPLAADEAGGAT